MSSSETAADMESVAETVTYGESLAGGAVDVDSSAGAAGDVKSSAEAAAGEVDSGGAVAFPLPRSQKQISEVSTFTGIQETEEASILTGAQDTKEALTLTGDLQISEARQKDLRNWPRRGSRSPLVMAATRRTMVESPFPCSEGAAELAPIGSVQHSSDSMVGGLTVVEKRASRRSLQSCRASPKSSDMPGEEIR